MISTYKTTRRIEFSDTDLAGLVHFSRFFIFMETAEHEFLRSLGTSVVAEYQGDTIGWPRLSASCDYKQPAFFEDELDITLRVIRKGQKSLTYGFTFERGGDEIAVGQIAVACCVCNHGEKIRAIEMPPEIAERIQEAC